MSTTGIPGIPLAAMAAGGILVWSGINNTTITATLTSLLHGSQPSKGPKLALVASTGSSGSGSSTGSSTDASALVSGALSAVTGGGGTPTANKSLGLLMASAYGWGGPGEWPYLESGWNEESGWNQHAANVPTDPYNHAYGIPQANPGSKMASAGADWKTNPATQIKWGLGYIKSVYGSPSRVPGWTPNGPAAGYVGY